MGRDIRECILHHVNAHRIANGTNSLSLEHSKCDDAQKDALYILENILRGFPINQCWHKNPWPNGYCHEINNQGYLCGNWDSLVQNLIWGILSVNDSHRERLLDLEWDGFVCNHYRLATEIAHDSNSGLTVLTVRLYP